MSSCLPLRKSKEKYTPAEILTHYFRDKKGVCCTHYTTGRRLKWCETRKNPDDEDNNDSLSHVDSDDDFDPREESLFMQVSDGFNLQESNQLY